MAEFDKIPLIAVVGPTASGKTGLGIELCKRLDGEVISADSMQIYKGMDIATAKPSREEMCGVPHHLMDFLERDTLFSVADYCREATACIADIYARGKQPILVGGTGLYISSLLENVEFSGEGADEKFRDKMKKRAETEGAQALLDELFKVDPLSAQKLHPNNLGRIIRALEVYELTGKTLSEQNRLSKLRPSPYEERVLFLTVRDRQLLYDRINARVDAMLKNGLVNEAEGFCDSEQSTAGKAIGPKELKPYFDGKISLEEATENIKRETRRYAKRQLTWFNRYESYRRIYIDECSGQEITEKALSELECFLNR